MNGGRQLKNKVKVRFWLNGHLLFVQNEETEEIKIIENQKQIAWFLNAHHLVAPEVKGVMYGYDVLNLFGQRNTFPPFSFVQL